MLAMQYRIRLPDDFDMDVIRRRIHDKGHLMDGFEGLGFKAFLYACRGKDGPENLYAPFYLWRQALGRDRFLLGEGFEALCQTFGRPPVLTWSVLAESTGAGLEQARWATIETVDIAPHTRLADLQRSESDSTCRAADDEGALATVSACSVEHWQLVRAQLWRQRPPSPSSGARCFRVGYVATPSLTGREPSRLAASAATP